MGCVWWCPFPTLVPASSRSSVRCHFLNSQRFVAKGHPQWTKRHSWWHNSRWKIYTISENVEVKLHFGVSLGDVIKNNSIYSLITLETGNVWCPNLVFNWDKEISSCTVPFIHRSFISGILVFLTFALCLPFSEYMALLAAPKHTVKHTSPKRDSDPKLGRFLEKATWKRWNLLNEFLVHQTKHRFEVLLNLKCICEVFLPGKKGHVAHIQFQMGHTMFFKNTPRFISCSTNVLVPSEHPVKA